MAIALIGRDILFTEMPQRAPPAAHRYRPTPIDGFPTATSRTQAETEAVLRDHLPPHAFAATANPNPNAPANTPPAEPELKKTAHMQFLIRNLVNGFSEKYISQDASQPWLLFWTLQAFSVLQVAIDPANAQRIINKVLTWQHPDGGFGGGPGQAAHLLPTYASICCLAIVGRPGVDGGWDQIDREKMYAFFMRQKQPDGSFTVATGGEVDVRGTYCLLAVASLLDLLTPALTAGTPAFLASCQTYEGGFASASCVSGVFGAAGAGAGGFGMGAGSGFGEGSGSGAGTGTGLDTFMYAGDMVTSVPTGSGGVQGYAGGGYDAEDVPRTRPALGEAHGGYTFCALASWVLLQGFVGGARGVIGGQVSDAQSVDAQSQSVDAPSGASTSASPSSTTNTQTETQTPTSPPPATSPSPGATVPAARIALPTLLRWLATTQGSPGELGGFRGRTNKLVDGCYAWWCGGAFALLEALGVGGMQNVGVEDGAGEEDGDKVEEDKDNGGDGVDKVDTMEGVDDGEGDVWDEVDDGLYNRKALQEYILCAGQHPAGGLRDKPPKNADAYHTLYCLSGLSAAQHHVFPSRARRALVDEAWRGNGRDTPAEDAARKGAFGALTAWTEEEGTSLVVGGPANRVNATHPLTNLTITHTEALAAHFYGQRLPPRARSVGRKV